MSASSVDPDIMAAYNGQPATSADASHVDPDIAKAFGVTAPSKGIPAVFQPHTPLAHFAAIAENALSGVTAGAGSLADAVTGSYPGTHDWGYRPRTAEGQALGQALGKGGSAVTDLAARGGGALVGAAGGNAPAATEELKARIPEALGAVGTVTALGGLAKGAFPRTAAFEDTQSMGAAHAPPDFSTADPDIQQAVSTLTPAEIEANRSTLENHALAQSLPVKMRLTEGMATQDPDVISKEMNNRAATGLSKTIQQLGGQLKENIQGLRDQVGPDVFTTNPVEHGQTLIDAYKAKDAPIQADINAKYQALRDAAGGNIPIDGQAFVNNARTALRKQLLTNDVPASIRSDMEGFSSGDPMNFEDFESMRTKLAQEMRDNPSGNARSAAGIVRQSLEDLPLQNGAEALKPLADQARLAARARFQALEADPAYKAAVNDAVPPDQFVNKFVTGASGSATKGQAALMRQNLAADPQAIQTMGVATIDELKKAALGQNGEGSFAQTRYNNRLESLRPKLGALLPPEVAENATNLGKVARLVKSPAEGNVVNTSGTLSGAIAHQAGNVAKSYLNVKSGGLAGPVIDYAQSKLSEAALKRQFQDATAPLAGVKRGTP